MERWRAPQWAGEPVVWGRVGLCMHTGGGGGRAPVRACVRGARGRRTPAGGREGKFLVCATPLSAGTRSPKRVIRRHCISLSEPTPRKKQLQVR